VSYLRPVGPRLGFYRRLSARIGRQQARLFAIAAVLERILKKKPPATVTFELIQGELESGLDGDEVFRGTC